MADSSSLSSTGADPDDLPPMFSALTIIEPLLIYSEARLQYSILLAEAQRNGTPPASINLPLHYKYLFESATEGLDEWERHKLLAICFAYKTKARVLRYLGLLDQKEFVWVRRFEKIVESCGMDSWDTEDIASHDSASDAMDGDIDMNSVNNGSETEHDEKQDQLYFIIPTLPLAFPSTFFTILATHAPLSSLTIENVLTYPAALLLPLNRELRKKLHKALPSFVAEPEPLPASPLPANPLLRYAAQKRMKTQLRQRKLQHLEEKVVWDGMFSSLLDRDLDEKAGETLRMPDGSELECGSEGYDEVEHLEEMWLSAWVDKRCIEDIEMRRKEGLFKTLLGVGSGDVEGEGDLSEVLEDDMLGDEDEETIETGGKDGGENGLVLGNIPGLTQLVSGGGFKENAESLPKGEKKKRCVGWNEDALVQVKEIPARPQQKKRKKKKNW